VIVLSTLGVIRSRV